VKRDINVTDARARQIVLAARPHGKPQLTDFRVEDTAVPLPRDRQLLLRVRYLSLDPYMRGRMDDRKSYAQPLQLGDVMTGETVAQVVTSDHPAYAAGDLVLAPAGWRTHALSDGTGLRKLDPAVAPVTTALGVLGMPGFTAYGGLRVIGKPQPGETVVVAAASGPVGSLVVQLAQLAGARAVGIAGGPEKCAFLKDELRFDAAIDHRAADFPAQLAAACPNGIMNYDFAAEHHSNFLREVGASIADGRIRYREDIVDGLEKAPEAFIGMLEGRNFGKLIVRVAGNADARTDHPTRHP
jgi:NADPH-dependent curcumin reductase